MKYNKYATLPANGFNAIAACSRVSIWWTPALNKTVPVVKIIKYTMKPENVIQNQHPVLFDELFSCLLPSEFFYFSSPPLLQMPARKKDKVKLLYHYNGSPEGCKTIRCTSLWICSNTWSCWEPGTDRFPKPVILFDSFWVIWNWKDRFRYTCGKYIRSIFKWTEIKHYKATADSAFCINTI